MVNRRILELMACLASGFSEMDLGGSDVDKKETETAQMRRARMARRQGSKGI
jgi:hypothetical protein